MPDPRPIRKTPAERLKEKNSLLYYQVLDWKDTHHTLFDQATGGRQSVNELPEPELLSIIMLTTQQLMKPE